MKKHLDTVYDHFDTASTGELLKQVSTELAERVLSKLPRPLPTELDIEVR